MLGDSSPLPKSESVSLTLRWLLLFEKIGLKIAAWFFFFLSVPPTWIMPIHSHLWAQYYRTNLLFHMCIYIQLRESWWMNFRCVSLEFERMFPFLDSMRPLGVKSLRCALCSFHPITSPQTGCSLLLNFCMKQSKCLNIIHNIYKQSHF